MIYYFVNVNVVFFEHKRHRRMFKYNIAYKGSLLLNGKHFKHL